MQQATRGPKQCAQSFCRRPRMQSEFIRPLSTRKRTVTVRLTHEFLYLCVNCIKPQLRFDHFLQATNPKELHILADQCSKNSYPSFMMKLKLTHRHWHTLKLIGKLLVVSMVILHSSICYFFLGTYSTGTIVGDPEGTFFFLHK